VNSRWFNIAVFVLWVTTMSWLVIVKIVPSLAVGDPPDRSAILSAQAEEQLVGYEVRWNEDPVGSALVRGERLASGGTVIDGQVRFDRLPVRQMVPEGIVRLFRLDGAVPEQIRLDAENHVFFHATGRLQRFDSTLSLEPGVSRVMVEGFVVGDTLILTIRSAGAGYEMRRPLPRNVTVSNALIPQSRMPGLREGQRWTLEVYSAFRPPTDPMEIMQAEVVGRDPISWEGRLEDAWLVVYRGDPGGEVGRAGKEHAWLWVRDDGMVLQHRISVFDGALTFVRLAGGSEKELEQQFRAAKRAAVSVEPDEDPSLAQGAEDATEAEAEAEEP
jgi:hypothetical protein